MLPGCLSGAAAVPQLPGKQPREHAFPNQTDKPPTLVPLSRYGGVRMLSGHVAPHVAQEHVIAWRDGRTDGWVDGWMDGRADE